MGNLGFLFSLPLVGAFVGWGTNYIAVKMIFHPRKPYKVFGFTIQGLLPKRQADLAVNVGEVVAEDLVSSSDLGKALESPEVMSALGGELSAQVDKLIQNAISSNPMFALVLQGAMKEEIVKLIKVQLESAAPEIIDRAKTSVLGAIDIRKIVEEKIKAFDLGKLEAIVYKISAQELRAIEVLGGVLGLLIGIIQAGYAMLGM